MTRKLIKNAKIQTKQVSLFGEQLLKLRKHMYFKCAWLKRLGREDLITDDMLKVLEFKPRDCLYATEGSACELAFREVYLKQTNLMRKAQGKPERSIEDIIVPDFESNKSLADNDPQKLKCAANPDWFEKEERQRLTDLLGIEWDHENTTKVERTLTKDVFGNDTYSFTGHHRPTITDEDRKAIREHIKSFANASKNDIDTRAAQLNTYDPFAKDEPLLQTPANATHQGATADDPWIPPELERFVQNSPLQQAA